MSRESHIFGTIADRISTSYDYTKGKLDELIGVIIDSGAKLFVCAIGVPPKHVVERLHKAGILYMNMIGHPKHVQKCLDVGADMICAQGGEGGGHTGDVPTTILIPTVAEIVKGWKSPMTGDQVQVVAAGGLFNGQSLAAALMLGAGAVWIGTRFVLCDEAGAPEAHQEAVRTSGFDDNVRTIIFTVGFIFFCASSCFLNSITNFERRRSRLTFLRADLYGFAITLTLRIGKKTVHKKSRI